MMALQEKLGDHEKYYDSSWREQKCLDQSGRGLLLDWILKQTVSWIYFILN